MPRKKIPTGSSWSPTLTLELATIAGPNASGIGLLISGLASEEVIEKWWPGVQGRIDQNQLQDLYNVVLNSLHEAIIFWTGVQQVLQSS